MTGTERRLRELERQVAELKDATSEKAFSYYDIARERCREYWELVRSRCDGSIGYNECMKLTRVAFKDKRSCCFCGARPVEYVMTAEDADEFIALFKRFLTLYMDYQREGTYREW